MLLLVQITFKNNPPNPTLTPEQASGHQRKRGVTCDALQQPTVLLLLLLQMLVARLTPQLCSEASPNCGAGCTGKDLTSSWSQDFYLKNIIIEIIILQRG